MAIFVLNPLGMQLQIDNQPSVQVEFRQGCWYVQDIPVDWGVERLPDGSWLLEYLGRRYRVELMHLDRASKTLQVRMGTRVRELKLLEPLDELLGQLGMQETEQRSVREILAPMPGLVLRLDVQAGQQVHQGDSLLVLEAMKMENVFKAPQDGIVLELRVEAHQPVEKGQVLLVLD